MAKVDVSGVDELMRDIERIAQLPDRVLGGMLKAGAAVAATAQKRKLAGLGIREWTGQLEASITHGDMKRDRAGLPCCYVYPQGTRRGKKTRNAEVGFILEYGAPGRGIAPRPWMRPANEEAAEAVTAAEEKVYGQWLDGQ